MNNGEDAPLLADYCTFTRGEHKYYIFSTKSDFEPVTDLEIIDITTDQLYRRIEYAVISCNCGSVLRKRVRQQ